MVRLDKKYLYIWPGHEPLRSFFHQKNLVEFARVWDVVNFMYPANRVEDILDL